MFLLLGIFFLMIGFAMIIVYAVTGRITNWILSFILIVSLSLYYHFTPVEEVQNWLAVGQTHYQLLETFAQFGGMEGAIARIQHHLALHPDDKKARVLLDKLKLGLKNQNSDD